LKNKRFIVLLQITLVLPISAVLSHEAFTYQTQEPSVEDKFNPRFTYDWLHSLSIQNPTEVVSTIVWLIEDEEIMGMNMSQLKQHAVEVFTKQHNATVWYLAKVFSFVHIMTIASEIEKIAAYEFVDQINMNGDFVHVHLGLDVSVPTIRVDNVWGLNYNGSGLRIAIIDSGINQSHPDLDDLDDNPSTSDPKVIAEQDFTGEGITVDSIGHGTHCAGIAAGTGAASNGVYKGVAPGAWLLEARVRNSTGDYDVNWLTDAIDWAVSNDTNIISLSMGVTYFDGENQIRTDGTDPPSPAADEAVEQGVVFVAMAGNFNATKNPENYITAPGDAFNVITVGASDDDNTEGINDDTVPWWSSRGPTGDNRFKPDVVAPGVNVFSPDPVGAGGYYPGDYGDFSGTSAATPHVAGVAALLLQAHPGWTPGIVKSVIMGTARLNDNLQSLTENDRGKGIVDAERALTCPIDIPTDEADGESESGFGIYIAQANLNGTYLVMAEAYEFFLVAWADAVLYKSYTPEEDMVNPTFYFGFHDIGALLVAIGSAYFDAKLKLWEGENQLFAYQERIHTLDIVGYYTTDCFHTISYRYNGVLLAGHTYDIEYGFYAYATTYLIGTLSSATFTVQALSLSVTNVLGPGNPSFEERLKSVYEPAYWDWSNVDNDWRDLRGDVNGDGKCDMKDLGPVANGVGANHVTDVTSPKYCQYWHPIPCNLCPHSPDYDINGDDKIDMKDLGIVAREFGKYANCTDGSYSWYTSGNGTYNMTQWLCDHDVNALKDHQITFSFWFKPNATENKAQAKITYIISNGSQTTISGDWVYATQDWHNANITTTLPTNTIAIKVIIHFTDNFQTWIDKTTIVTL